MVDPLPSGRVLEDAACRRASPTLIRTDGTLQLRADAARNRNRLLEVANRLAAERGIANVTMEDIASGAGVGKGTVFRRFGDRTGLLVALLSHYEQQLQAAMISGPPPLGPGAAPVERLLAFGSAVIAHEYAHRDFYLAAAHGDQSRHHTSPAYQFRLTQACLLPREAKVEGDIELIASTLLGYLETVLLDHLITGRRMSPERVQAGWHDLVGRCTSRSAD